MKITVYGQKNCAWCDRVKTLLDTRGYAFVYHDIGLDSSIRQEFDRRTNGAKTVPQVFVGDQLIGGFDETLKSISTGRFQQIVGGF